jgi:hypothetical protein
MLDPDLARKLLLKPGMQVRLVGAPPGYAERLGGQTAGEPAFVQVFVRDKAELERRLGDIRHPAGGLLWISFRKGGKKAGTDLNRDLVWQRLEREGLAGVTLVSIDDEWSAMRLRPLEEVGRPS